MGSDDLQIQKRDERKHDDKSHRPALDALFEVFDHLQDKEKDRGGSQRVPAEAENAEEKILQNASEEPDHRYQHEKERQKDKKRREETHASVFRIFLLRSSFSHL